MTNRGLKGSKNGWIKWKGVALFLVGQPGLTPETRTYARKAPNEIKFERGIPQIIGLDLDEIIAIDFNLSKKMNFTLLKNEVKELTLQELSLKIMTEEQFDDNVWEIFHKELDREISYLSLKEIDEIIVDFGLNKALYIAMSNTGLCSSPEHGEDIYSPSILYQAVQENTSITWDDYKEWRDEQDEDEDEDEEEEKTNCDDCNELFKTVGSLTIRMMFEDKMLCKDCCIKRCDAIEIPDIAIKCPEDIVC